MSTTTTRTSTVATVPLPGGREFEAVLLRAGDGEPLDLLLSVSFASEGRGWRNHAGSLALPPSSLREVAAALMALAEAGR